MACVGMAEASVAETIRQLEAHRDRATGFAPVVLATVPPPDIARHLDEDLLLDADRRFFIGSRSGIVVESMEPRDSYIGPDSFDNHLLEKIAELRLRHRIGSVAAVDIGHPDAWLVLQAARG